MSRLMQLPSLYGVRGSIATQTMASMADAQIAEIDKLVRQIADDPILAADKQEFKKQLANTIQGDYRSDQSIAEHEFYIAIWRATVYLLHHRNYSYYCVICGAYDYETSTGKKKAFDRQYPICPNCGQTWYNNAVATLSRSQHGYKISIGDTLYHSRAEAEKAVVSPIKTTCGDRKIDNPHKILDDPVQRNKWYSVWIWNYFRQILNENVIRTHNKHLTEINAPAQQAATHIILNELKRGNYRYYFDELSLKINNLHYEIFISPSTISDNLIKQLIKLERECEYHNYNITIALTDYSIKIDAVGDTPIVSTNITTENPVIMLSYDTPASDDMNHGWSDALEFNTAGGRYDTLSSTIQADYISTIRGKLPDGICRQIFDIYIQNGAIWLEFTNEYGYKEAAKSHLAKFFGVSTKRIDEYRSQIAAVCREMHIGDPE